MLSPNYGTTLALRATTLLGAAMLWVCARVAAQVGALAATGRTGAVSGVQCGVLTRKARADAAHDCLLAAVWPAVLRAAAQAAGGAECST